MSGQQPINAEHEEWVNVVDPETGQLRRVRRANYSITEVSPGASAAQPSPRQLTED